jgi:hypothetical protein
MLKTAKVIRNGNDEKVILVIDLELKERLWRVEAQESSSHLSVSSIEYYPPGRISDL